MGNILLLIMVLIVFSFGYFVTYRFGKFMEKNFPAYKEPQTADMKVYIAETGEKSAETVSKEVGAMLDLLTDRDKYGIIICKTVDSRFTERLKESGCSVEYGFRK